MTSQPIPTSRLDLSLTNLINIAKLTLFCRDYKGDTEFNIMRFAWEIDNNHEIIYPSDMHYDCNTSACFCGLGLAAGIKPEDSLESWFDYATHFTGYETNSSSNLWDLLFHESHENKLSSAVLRAAYLLNHGLPPYESDGESSEDNYLTTWEASTSFIPDWDQITHLANQQPTDQY